MKQYLKMGEHFSGVVNVDNDGNVSDDKFHRGSLGDFDEKYFEVIAHAINSHDELVQMNQELLAALEECAKELAWMIDKHNEQNMEDGSWKYDHQTPWEAMQLVVKAKGGAA